MLAIPGNTLIITASACFCRHKLHCVGGRDHFPFGVIKAGRSAVGDISQMETPSRIKIIDLTAGILQRYETGNGNLLRGHRSIGTGSRQHKRGQQDR